MIRGKVLLAGKAHPTCIDLRGYLDRVDWVDAYTDCTYPTSVSIAFTALSTGRSCPSCISSAEAPTSGDVGQSAPPFPSVAGL